jgi:molybdopterin biosynthesis enzyme
MWSPWPEPAPSHGHLEIAAMSTSLATLSETLAAALGGIAAVTPVSIAASASEGRLLAAEAASPGPCPAAAIALRSGFAVASLDLVGASMHSPAPLPGEPTRVRIGEALPAGCDAVIDPEAVIRQGAMWLASESPAPGSHARLQGHDLAAQGAILPAGSRVTREAVLAFRLAGVAEVLVRRPVVALAHPDAAIRDWLAGRLVDHGAAIARPGEAPDLVLRAAVDEIPRIALRPGEGAWIAAGPPPAIELPARFDGAVAALFALALPALDRLMGASARMIALPLRRKVSSSIGSSELALLALVDGAYEPVCVGEATLGALARADAVALLPPGSEGLATGESLAAWPLSASTERFS